MSCVMTIPQAGRKEPMGEFIKSQGWQNCLQTRAQQRYWGALCAPFLLLLRCRQERAAIYNAA